MNYNDQRAPEAPTASPSDARRRARSRARSRGAALKLLSALAVLSLIAACSNSAPAQRLEPVDNSVQIQSGVTYSTSPSDTLKLDACLPPGTDTARRAIVLVHGGGFTESDRASGGMRSLCTLVAEFGIAAFSIDYRLAPKNVYPSQVDDLGNAVAWLRKPEQVKQFGINPARIGVLGSSAGAIMAQSIATRGTGPLDRGQRVKAVVSLSGVSLMTPEGLTLGSPSSQARALILTYLGCRSITTSCPQSKPASPLTSVDKTDPPMLLVNGSSEIVPQEQPAQMETSLKAAGVAVQLDIVDGSDHGVALLNSQVRADIKTFLDRYL